MPENKLDSAGPAGKLWNVFSTFCWALVWLGRWGLRLLGRIFSRYKG